MQHLILYKNAALSPLLPELGALKGWKQLNPDQKEYFGDISNHIYRYERDLPHGRGPGK
jgi:hypothetical protein